MNPTLNVCGIVSHLIPFPVDLKYCPPDPEEPWAFKTPLIVIFCVFIVPLTSNFVEGRVEPIPTLFVRGL